jgi:hypothetical protein
MKPELVSFFRYMLKIQGMDTSLGGAKRYLQTLTPDAVKTIVGLDADKQQLYNNLEDMVGRLVWKHGPHWTIHQYIPPEVQEIEMSKKKTAFFRIIGDVHGKYDRYAHKASEAEYSLQVGDMGFDYRYITRVLDSDKHKVIGGNHDNYTKYLCVCNPVDEFKRGPGKEDCPLCHGKGYTYGDQSKHFLNDYGVHTIPGFSPIFYVRGAWSIDYKYRTPEISWWEDEEIPPLQMAEALEVYKVIKPDFVVSHTVPFSIVPSIPFERIFGETIHKPRTETLLEEMYEIHQPKWWVFGHWHTDFSKIFQHLDTNNKTRFICLGELSHIDFPENFNIDEDFEPIIE